MLRALSAVGRRVLIGPAGKSGNGTAFEITAASSLFQPLFRRRAKEAIMRSKKTQSTSGSPEPIYRQIPPAAPAPAKDRSEPAQTLRELDGYATEVQALLQASEMQAILDGLEADLKRAGGAPRLRISRR